MCHIVHDVRTINKKIHKKKLRYLCIYVFDIAAAKASSFFLIFQNSANIIQPRGHRMTNGSIDYLSHCPAENNTVPEYDHTLRLIRATKFKKKYIVFGEAREIR